MPKVQIGPAPLYRLTLAPEAFCLAISKHSPIAGKMAVARKDGKWDVGVSLAVADLLKQNAKPGENLSDTTVRVLGGAH